MSEKKNKVDPKLQDVAKVEPKVETKSETKAHEKDVAIKAEARVREEDKKSAETQENLAADTVAREKIAKDEAHNKEVEAAKERLANRKKARAEAVTLLQEQDQEWVTAEFSWVLSTSQVITKQCFQVKVKDVLVVDEDLPKDINYYRCKLQEEGNLHAELWVERVTVQPTIPGYTSDNPTLLIASPHLIYDKEMPVEPLKPDDPELTHPRVPVVSPVEVHDNVLVAPTNLRVTFTLTTAPTEEEITLQKEKLKKTPEDHKTQPYPKLTPDKESSLQANNPKNPKSAKNPDDGTWGSW